MKQCKFEECDKPTAAKGWCAGHYSQWQHHGVVWELGRKSKQTGYTEEKTCVTCKETKHYTKFVLGMVNQNYDECRDCYRARILPPKEPEAAVDMEEVINQIDTIIAKKRRRAKH